MRCGCDEEARVACDPLLTSPASGRLEDTIQRGRNVFDAASSFERDDVHVVSDLNGAVSSMSKIEASHAEHSSVKGVATCAGVKMRGTAKLPHKHALVTLLA